MLRYFITIKKFIDDYIMKNKERTPTKQISSEKLLAPMLLAQIKVGNNSYKLKNEIRQRLYLLYQHNEITKKVYNNIIKPL